MANDVQFRLVISPKLGAEAEPLTKRYAIRLAFLLCRLLLARRCCRYLGRNLWLIAVACPLVHSQYLALAVATTKEVEIEMYF